MLEVEAGAGPDAGTWFVWGGPRPFDGYTVAERPTGATAMCAGVANEDHTIKLGTGNCVDPPLNTWHGLTRHASSAHSQTRI